jgi:hypothetical protein
MAVKVHLLIYHISKQHSSMHGHGTNQVHYRPTGKICLFIIEYRKKGAKKLLPRG